MQSRPFTLTLAAVVALAGTAGPVLRADEPLHAAQSSPHQTVTDGWSTTGLEYWIERQLELIRRDRPWPTTHARTLFHVSAAMHDAVAAYVPGRRGVLVDLKAADAPTEHADRLARITLGHAALEVMRARYARTNRDGLALLKLDHRLADAGLSGPLSADDAAAADLGRRIGRAILDQTLDDGSNETREYDDTTGYTPRNTPLNPAAPGTGPLADIDRWQPIIVRGRTQECVTPHWGRVRPFAIERAQADRPYLDPGPPPRLDKAGHPMIAAAMTELILLSARLDGLSSDPAATAEADYGRVCAEYWEAGLGTETPPGLWNQIALRCLERTAGEPGLAGLASTADVLLSLNGALHDAGIACWDIKMHYDSSRPITLIRAMAALGQSTDPAGIAYDPLGLPLVPGLIEVVTAESSAPGERHWALADHVGTVAIRCWRGTPDKQTVQTAGVDWTLGTMWKPYQNRNFVTPAFPGYVSGHSTFSAAAASVLESWFGDEIPGGPLTATAAAGAFLKFEHGPSHDVTLTWTTFQDAVNQAGRSRLWGGIHPCYDDLKGREVGRGAAEAVLAKMGRESARARAAR